MYLKTKRTPLEYNYMTVCGVLGTQNVMSTFLGGKMAKNCNI